MLVDSHCHLDRLDLTTHQNQLSNALNAARQKGVEHFLSISVDLDELPHLLSIAATHADVHCSVGVHPSDTGDQIVEASTLAALGQHPKIIAVGETGLDYYRNEPQTIKIQQENFRQHIRAAKQLSKPLVIHTRLAAEDTIAIIREEHAATVGGILHCFTESWEIAEQALAENFYISLSGIVTFKNADQVKELAMRVPLDRLLIETDSPYLAPVPFRGQSNEPAYVYYVAQAIAALRGIPFEVIAQQTTQNFYRLFQGLL